MPLHITTFFSNENLAVNCLTVIEEELNDEVSNVWMLLIIAHYGWGVAESKVGLGGVENILRFKE